MQMKTKRVTREWVSIVRRSAPCASAVIASASSRISSLKGGHGWPGAGGPTAPAAKALILERTMPMPRSSEALSSRTRVLKRSGLCRGERERMRKALRRAPGRREQPPHSIFNPTHPYSWRAIASAVDVLPVPGGP